VGGVAALMHALGRDIAALGSMVAAYAPLHEILQGIFAPPSDAPEPDAAPAPADEVGEAADPAPTPRKPRARRAAAKRITGLRGLRLR
jgi:hypothetical protein